PASGDVVLVREGGRSSTRRHIYLGEDIAEMPTHGLLRDEQGLGDLLIRLSRCDKPEHLTFALGQSARRRGPEERRNLQLRWPSAHVHERAVRRGEFGDRRLVVAERS